MRALFVVFVVSCSEAHSGSADAPRSVAATGDGGASPGTLGIVVLNEVSAQSDPDWFEIVNATTAPVDTSQFIFVDNAGDFAKAVPFSLGVLPPGGFATVDCDGVVVPFKLGSGEELWIYRAADRAVSDGTTWAVGDSPPGGSYARIPDVTGPFMTTLHPTKGGPNTL